MLDKKTEKEISFLREGGQLLGEILRRVATEVKVGKTGQELNSLAEDLIVKTGGIPSFKNYHGFPAGLCVSLNQTVVHGIPNKIPFKEGDLVGLDVGMQYKGLYTDTALTVAVGKVNKESEQLLIIGFFAVFFGIFFNVLSIFLSFESVVTLLMFVLLLSVEIDSIFNTVKYCR